ncbi:MAG: hypothetical protein FJ213_07730 [Ignavibacteria bacterium]|nr:hypothetical protein [Ignavibacteria bacterium]
MGTFDKKVDAYIGKSNEFAKPILNKLRTLVHKACPDVEEKIKWSFPHFDYKGMMCSMASFKSHCAFTFWKASLMKDKYKVFSNVKESAMGHLGRITSLKDLPSDNVMTEYIKEAMKLNDEGITQPKISSSRSKKELIVPDYFIRAISKNKKALKVFDTFSYSHKKEYVEWVTEAKTEETRNKRLATTVEWLAEGKGRNWKYEKK